MQQGRPLRFCTSLCITIATLSNCDHKIAIWHQSIDFTGKANIYFFSKAYASQAQTLIHIQVGALGRAYMLNIVINECLSYLKAPQRKHITAAAKSTWDGPQAWPQAGAAAPFRNRGQPGWIGFSNSKAQQEGPDGSRNSHQLS